MQWATGQWDAAAQTAEGALADGRGGITTRITAQYVLGYLAMGRGDWSAAGNLLREALATGERMAELQRLSPPLWGLAETARCRRDYNTALILCERGYQASAEVMDAACLFPYLLTGVRAHRPSATLTRQGVAGQRRGAHGPAIPARCPRSATARTHPARPGRGFRGVPGGGVGPGRMAPPRFWEGTWPCGTCGDRRKARRRARPPCCWTRPALAAAAGATTLVDDAEGCPVGSRPK